MKKYIITTFAVLIVILTILIAMSYKSSYSALYKEKILAQDIEIQNAFKNYEIVNCNFNLKNPEHAFVSFQHYIYPEDNSEMKFWRVDFYDLSRTNIFSLNWNIQRTGGTDIKNTTFPELVKMVKEDCGQFQKSKGNHDDPSINWSYSEYTPEPVLSPEAQAVQDKLRLISDVRLEISWLTKEEQKYVEEKYGITIYSDGDEIYEWWEKGLAEEYFGYEF